VAVDVVPGHEDVLHRNAELRTRIAGGDVWMGGRRDVRIHSEAQRHRAIQFFGDIPEASEFLLRFDIDLANPGLDWSCLLR
jgi:hypothetical protein